MQSSTTNTFNTNTAMPFAFGNKSSSRKKSQRPPNYLSRRVQWKIFMMVGMFMLVVIMMDKVRDPVMWEWMWAGSEAKSKKVEDDKPVDTRNRRVADIDTLNPDIPDAITIKRNEVTVNLQVPPDDAGEDDALLEQAQQDAWANFLELLDHNDKELLFKVLLTARGRRQLSDEEKQQWPVVLGKLDQNWTDYLDEAYASVNDEEQGLTDEERKQWLTTIDQLKSNWQDALKVQLSTTVSDVSKLTDDGHRDLRRLQKILDRVFLTAVEDNTVFRGAEANAWFRLLEQLDTATEPQLREQSVGKVSFVQLFKQPDEYRGRLVTMVGTVHMGFWSPPRKNIYGIGGYYVLWIKPYGGDSPVVVYTLDLPADFPEIKIPDDPKKFGERVKLSEDIEFTGYFFKRRPYLAQDDTRLAPLLLAKTPRWEPKVDWVARAKAKTPGSSFFIICLAGTGLLGIGVAVVVYRLSRWRSTNSLEEAIAARLSQANPYAAAPTEPPKDMLDSLKQLANDAD